MFDGLENAVIVAINHGLYFGPLDGLIDLPTVIKNLQQADGVLLSAGMVSQYPVERGELYLGEILSKQKNQSGCLKHSKK